MQEFRNTIMKELSNRLGDDHEIKAVDVSRNNGVVLHGVSIRKDGKNMAPTVYLESYVDDYRIGRKEISDIADRIIEIVQNADVSDKLIEVCGSYEQVKDRIRVALVNYEANLEMLKTRPHKRFLDLAVILYLDLNEDLKGVIQIHDGLCKAWEVSADEVIRKGMDNMISQRDYELCSMTDLLGALPGGDKLPPEAEAAVSETMVVTNRQKRYGASCMLHHFLLAEAADRTHSNLYIYPSSVHDLILAPARCGENNCLGSSMVQSVNQDAVMPEERLSNSVYLYDRCTGEVSIYQQGQPLQVA